MPRLQLLVATMNLTDIIGLCDKMHIASDVLIINQSDSVKYECVFYHGYKIECYTFAERGLSRSRNNALLRCTGEILCIADDDMVYTDTYREDIINEFQKHLEADALVFNVTALNDERSGKPIEKYARVGKRESREYGSVHIAIRKRALIGKNVYFNTLFGSGATYSCGEDTLFLKELIEKGLKLYKTPIRIASVDMSDSTWFKGIMKSTLEIREHLLKQHIQEVHTSLQYYNQYEIVKNVWEAIKRLQNFFHIIRLE